MARRIKQRTSHTTQFFYVHHLTMDGHAYKNAAVYYTLRQNKTAGKRALKGHRSTDQSHRYVVRTPLLYRSRGRGRRQRLTAAQRSGPKTSIEGRGAKQRRGPESDKNRGNRTQKVQLFEGLFKVCGFCVCLLGWLVRVTRPSPVERLNVSRRTCTAIGEICPKSDERRRSAESNRCSRGTCWRSAPEGTGWVVLAPNPTNPPHIMDSRSSLQYACQTLIEAALIILKPKIILSAQNQTKTKQLNQPQPTIIN